MGMIGHQHPAPHPHAVHGAMMGQKIAIGRVIGVRKESLLPPVAALGHMVRDAGNHEASKAGHRNDLAAAPRCVN